MLGWWSRAVDVRRACVPALAATAMLVGCTRVVRSQQGRTPVTWETRPSTVTGDLRLHEFRSRVFDNTRLLRVLLPEGYDAPANRDRRYPVLYLNDGQNVFDARTSSSGMEWRVDETVRAMVRGGRIPPMIVVGVDNAGPVRRTMEYLPYPTVLNRQLVADPYGWKYPEFLVGEVIPFINERYRTVRGPAGTALGGSSFGGFVSLYTAMVRPGVFGRLLVESPTLYVGDGRIFREIPKTTAWPARMYVGIGTAEGVRHWCPPPDAPNRLVDDVRHLARLLRRAGVDSSRLDVVVEQCAHHDEEAWGRRLPDALAFLFTPGP